MSSARTAPAVHLDRTRLWGGEVLQLDVTAASAAFRDHCWELVVQAFAPHAPHDAQHVLSVEDFVAVLSVLKPSFVHDATSKRLLGDLLEAAGCDREDTYFDLPKLRVVSSDGYLTSGLGYAYHAHRDIWYAAPPCQVNWWMPLTEVVAQNSLAFHPDFWEKPVSNDSGGFDAYDWNAHGRADAAKYVRSDTRNHPQSPVAFDPTRDLVVLPPPASCITFSAAQLHSTIPNTSGSTRFSVDFRTVSLSDLRERAGARQVDNGSTGTTLRDFLNVDTLAPLPTDVIEAYDLNSTHQGTLVFEPGTGQVPDQR